MVKSTLNEEIEYEESVDIEKNDDGYKSYIYEANLFDERPDEWIFVTLGKMNCSYEKKGVCYFSIYLLENKKVKGRIGVFEISSKKKSTMTNKDGKIILENLRTPILFGNFTTKKTRSPDLVSEKEEIKKDKDPWIAKFMKDTNFGITLTSVNGDCFFDTVRIALESVGINKTILELRTFVANDPQVKSTYDGKKELFYGQIEELIALNSAGSNLNDHISFIRNYFGKEERTVLFDEFFDGFKHLHLNIVKRSIDANDRQLCDIIKPYFGKVDFTPNDAMLLSVGLKKLIEEEAKNADYKSENPNSALNIGSGALSKAIVNSETKAKEEENFEKYKEYMLRPNYWADEFSIGVLEKNLNVKIIIFLETEYDEYISKKKEKYEEAKKSASSGKSEKEVRSSGKMPVLKPINCASIDLELQQRGDFSPDYYILATYDGAHYRLITYNNQSIFPSFLELPIKIKDMVVSKCTNERGDGSLYDKIQEISTYKGTRRGGKKRRAYKQKTRRIQRVK